MEQRREPRHPISGRMLILWQDGEGAERVTRAQCLDVSASGIRLRLLEKVPHRATVMFNCPELGLAGRGVVRHCTPRKAAYEIGVECLCGTSWRTAFDRLRSEVNLAA